MGQQDTLDLTAHRFELAPGISVHQEATIEDNAVKVTTYFTAPEAHRSHAVKYRRNGSYDGIMDVVGNRWRHLKEDMEDLKRTAELYLTIKLRGQFQKRDDLLQAFLSDGLMAYCSDEYDIRRYKEGEPQSSAILPEPHMRLNDNLDLFRGQVLEAEIEDYKQSFNGNARSNHAVKLDRFETALHDMTDTINGVGGKFLEINDTDNQKVTGRFYSFFKTAEDMMYHCNELWIRLANDIASHTPVDKLHLQEQAESIRADAVTVKNRYASFQEGLQESERTFDFLKVTKRVDGLYKKQTLFQAMDAVLEQLQSLDALQASVEEGIGGYSHKRGNDGGGDSGHEPKKGRGRR